MLDVGNLYILHGERNLLITWANKNLWLGLRRRFLVVSIRNGIEINVCVLSFLFIIFCFKISLFSRFLEKSVNTFLPWAFQSRATETLRKPFELSAKFQALFSSHSEEFCGVFRASYRAEKNHEAHTFCKHFSHRKQLFWASIYLE